MQARVVSFFLADGDIECNNNCSTDDKILDAKFNGEEILRNFATSSGCAWRHCATLLSLYTSIVIDIIFTTQLDLVGFFCTKPKRTKIYIESLVLSVKCI